MAMNLQAVVRIGAQVTGLGDLSKLEKGIGGVEAAAGSAKNGFKAMLESSAWQTAAVAAAGLGVAIGTSVKAAIDFESAMADVRKVVPGLDSAEGFNAMKQSIIEMSRELPVSADGLAAIMAAAGQAGIASTELEEFTRTAAQMGIAFDISAEQAGAAMATLRTALGLNQKEVTLLSDAMNFLSNNMASSASEILNFMDRAGAVGQQVAMSAEQTAALGSAMIAAGAPAEVAATSFRNLIRALSTGESATARQAEAFQRLGLTATEVASRMQEDAVGTIRDVFQRISQLPAELRVSTVSEVFGDEARALTPLITNMKLFEQAIGLVGDKSKYTGSMLQEFRVRSQTTANQLQLFQNNVRALQIAFGDALLPAINLVAQALLPLLSALANVASRAPILTAAVAGLATAFVGLVAAAPFISGFITLLGQISLLLPQLGVLFAGLQTAAIVAFSGITTWLTSTFLPAVLAIFSGPVGWTVLAIAAVVAMAIAFREPILQFFSWLGAAIGDGLQALWRWGEPIRKFWQGVWDAALGFARSSLEAIGNILGNAAKSWYAITYQVFARPFIELWNNGLRQPVQVAGQWLQSAFQSIGQTFNAYVIQPLTNGWRAVMEFLPRAMQAAATAVTNTWKAVINAIRSVINGTLTAIGNAINAVAGQINRLITAFNRLPGPDIPLVPTLSVPQFADGGYVTRRTLAEVGEGGEPEYIIPESKMAAASANYLRGGRGAEVIPTTSSSGGTPPGAAPQINITTGPVMEFDGRRYVTLSEYERGLRQTAEAVLGRLRTPAARAAFGMR